MSGDRCVRADLQRRGRGLWSSSSVGGVACEYLQQVVSGYLQLYIVSSCCLSGASVLLQDQNQHQDQDQDQNQDQIFHLWLFLSTRD